MPSVVLVVVLVVGELLRIVGRDSLLGHRLLLGGLGSDSRAGRTGGSSGGVVRGRRARRGLGRSGKASGAGGLAARAGAAH